MEVEGGDSAGVLELESHASDDLKSEKQLPDTNYVSNGNIAVENGRSEERRVGKECGD